MFKVVAVDIGLRNMALAELSVPELHAPMHSCAQILALPWECTAVQNLELAGGTVADVCQQLFFAMRASGQQWEQRVRSATAVVIETQNGKYSPQNYALQHAVQMWAYGARNHNCNVFFVNNAHKLHNMTLYGLIPDRGERLQWNQDLPPPQKRKRSKVSHHYNKKDVVAWVRTRPESQVAHVFQAGGDKPDDVCDALTHALSFWWEQLESPTLRHQLGRRRPRAIITKV